MTPVPVTTRNEVKLQELMTYIEKHQEEIIDYDKQKKVGKEVGLKPSLVGETDQTEETEAADEADVVVQNQASKSQTTKKVVVHLLTSPSPLCHPFEL